MTLHQLRPLAPILAAAALTGCLGGLLGGKPDRLYRFGAAAAPPPAGRTAPGAPARTIALAPPVFAGEVAGARVLTVEGREASYLKDVRWVSPASALFGEALEAGFAARAPWLEPAQRREKAGADSLQVSINRFEAAYAGERGSPPTVRVAGSAVLIDGGTGERIATWRIAEEQPAAADRVGAIVDAFDAAVARAVAGTVDWTATTEARRPRRIAQ